MPDHKLFTEALWAKFVDARGHDGHPRLDQNGYEEDLRALLASQLYASVLPETQAILRKARQARFLRPPQITSLEMYIYLKECLGNRPLLKLYPEILDHRLFDGILQVANISEALALTRDEAELERRLKEALLMPPEYPSPVFGLAMGTGKTILIACLIAYEFALSAAYPEDPRFAHNALVIAPDTTVLDSLSSMERFDLTNVLPTELARQVQTNMSFNPLVSDKSPIDVWRERGQVIISNIQKFSIRTRTVEEDPLWQMKPGKQRQTSKTDFVNERLNSLELVGKNGRLAVFVDEGHHAYGADLSGELKRQRQTIDYLNASCPIATCSYFTGTPYYDNEMLPGVVVRYLVDAAIKDLILKEVDFRAYANTRSEEFVTDVLREFYRRYGDKRPEGLTPKIAFYASDVDELLQELQPQVERVLSQMGIPTDLVLVDHSKLKGAAAAEVRRRKRLLDTPNADAQVILQVGKGKEGWDCRSLYACAMYRSPRSRNFLLQASLRCLRAIGDMPQKATVFVSQENLDTLDKELRQQMGVERELLEITRTPVEQVTVVRKRPVKLRLKRPVKKITAVHRTDCYLRLNLEEACRNLRAVVAEREGLTAANARTEALTVEQRPFTALSLCGELSRLTRLGAVEVQRLLTASDVGLEETARFVSMENRLLRYIADLMLQQCYSYEETVESLEDEIELFKYESAQQTIPRTSRERGLVLTEANLSGEHPETFHIDPYIFDSGDERQMLLQLLAENDTVSEVYFTGGITDATLTDFWVFYKHPSGWTRRYYPDFLVHLKDGRWLVAEVKRTELLDDPETEAKRKAAELVFVDLNAWGYKVIPSDVVSRGDGARTVVAQRGLNM